MEASVINTAHRLSDLQQFVLLQIGALMNETYQAQNGMEAGTFPAGVPTYLGHYHVPHTVGESNIRYVGSPYQGELSLAVMKAQIYASLC